MFGFVYFNGAGRTLVTNRGQVAPALARRREGRHKKDPGLGQGLISTLRASYLWLALREVQPVLRVVVFFLPKLAAIFY